jgi:hypothetical protein
MPALLSSLAVETILETIAARMNGGKIVLYSNAEPATADAALSSNTVLAEMAFGSPAFGEAVITSNARTITANPVTSDLIANATGEAVFFRGLMADNTVVLQGSVGISSADMLIVSTVINAGNQISLDSLEIAMGADPQAQTSRAFSGGFSDGFS